ncbi:hypothetical protein PPACK8108_LOCUS21417 [Phakopsora pachyrhizi]|uniref:Uncharacterized protein n=1 Tax=Phakopsora pachyrhizi TaxID=170000 RepID=A0AAV0BK66_PHAPC|nr:hypothetical protein PPACK8108_LOCUS21417 [Phakopsora pachyrhizi]
MLANIGDLWEELFMDDETPESYQSILGDKAFKSKFLSNVGVPLIRRSLRID